MFSPQQVTDLVSDQLAGHRVVQHQALGVGLRQPQGHHGHRGSSREVRSASEYSVLHFADLPNIGKTLGVPVLDVREIVTPREEDHGVVAALLGVTSLVDLVGVTLEDSQKVREDDCVVKVLGQLVVVFLPIRFTSCAELSTDLVDLHSVDLDFESSPLPTEGVVGEVSLHLDHQTVEHSAGDSHKDV